VTTRETITAWWFGAIEECWLWPHGRFKAGYGCVGRNEYAHRVAFEHYRGPIPKGLHLDHLCRTKACFNPWHLEPVTFQENIRRARTYPKECPQGHEYTPENMKGGRRDCRACRRDQERARQQRKRLGDK